MIDPAPGRRQFLVLAALFLVPLFAAYALYFLWPQLRPSGRTNYGELISPARPLPAWNLSGTDGTPITEPFKHKWTLLMLGTAACDAACLDKLVQTRQLRILLNAERGRVQRIYLAPSAVALQTLRETLLPIHGDLLLLTEHGPPKVRAFFAPTESNAVYLIDPLGHWLMRYPATAEYKGVLKDLKLLLKLSHIG